MPFLVKIGPFLVHTQVVGWFLAYFIGVFGLIRFVRRDSVLTRDPNFDFQTFLSGMIICGLASILGARVSAILLLTSTSQWQWFLDHPAEIFKFWKSGFSFYGVVAATVVTGVWYGLRHNLPIFRIADLGMFWVIIGHGIQNFGDFFTGAHPGSPTSLPWGVTFSHWGVQAPRGIPLHPFLLYISAICMIGLPTSWAWFQARDRKDGKFFLSWMYHPVFRLFRLRFFNGEQVVLAGCFYSYFRFFAEFFRGPQTQIYYPGWSLPQSQMACIVVFCWCFGFYLIHRAVKEAAEEGKPYKEWMKGCLKIVRVLEVVSKKIPWQVK